MIHNQIFLLAILLISSYFDIKYKEVENWLTIPPTFIILITTYLFDTKINFALSLIGTFAFFLLGIGFYYFNLWGGADAKLLTAIGAALGINISTFFMTLIIPIIIYIAIHIKYKTKKNPFIPALTLSYIISLTIIYL